MGFDVYRGGVSRVIAKRGKDRRATRRLAGIRWVQYERQSDDKSFGGFGTEDVEG
jgi:hypothetical protein